MLSKWRKWTVLLMGIIISLSACIGNRNSVINDSSNSNDSVSKAISSIHVYHCAGSSIPFEEYEIDLKNKKTTILVRGGFIGRTDKVKEGSPVIKNISDDSIKEFLNAARENGFENWEEEYMDTSIKDGHQWGITISFSNGIKKEIKGSNEYPYTWNKMLAAFKNLTGENILWEEAVESNNSKKAISIDINNKATWVEYKMSSHDKYELGSIDLYSVNAETLRKKSGVKYTSSVSNLTYAGSAVKVAAKAFTNIYKDCLEKEIPFQVFFNKNANAWIVHGTLPKGWAGGVGMIAIEKDTGEVLFLSHGK